MSGIAGKPQISPTSCRRSAPAACFDVSTGDTVRWVVGDTSSGQGNSRRVHILVKPTLPDIQTNLVVLTDRRAYHLELVSTKQTYMASISWT